MLLSVDIHFHTSLSSCSTFSMEALVETIRRRKLPIVTATDHGSAAACDILREALPETTVVSAVEVTTQEGDFLVYSTDEEYVRSLGTYAGTVKDLRCDHETALVWAHPRVPQVNGWESPSEQNPEIAMVLSYVDGLEIFNGMMLGLATQGVVRTPYFNHLNYLADRFDVAITGGSDAHEEESFFKAWTDFEGPVKSVQDFVTAIKERRVRPCYDHNHFDIGVDLQPLWTNDLTDG